MKAIACFDSLSESRGVYGRTVANQSLLSAILDYSSIDEVHFFLGDLYERENFFKSAGFLSGARGKRVKVFLRNEAKRLFLRNDYQVILQPDVCIGPVASWRNVFARSVPVFGLTHSISYPRFMLEFMKYDVCQSWDAIVATSPTAKTVLENAFAYLGLKSAPYIDVIPFGAEENARVNDAKQRAGYDEDSFVFLYIGRISEYSKADLFPMIRAFYLLSKENKDARMIIAGSSAESNYSHIVRMFIEKHNLAGRVKVYEDINEDEKALLYSLADCFISLSDNLQETFGLTLLEAASYGLPVIASDWDGYKSIVVDGETGFLIDTIASLDVWEQIEREAVFMYENMSHFAFAQTTVVSIDMLLDRMRRISSDRSLAERMGNRALELVKERFSWKEVVKQYERLWDRLKNGAMEHPAGERDVKWKMPFSKLFAHYMTEDIMFEDAQFEITEFGRDVVEGKSGLFLYEAHGEDMSVKLLKDILSMPFPCSFGQITKRFESYPQPVIMRHILWLWKEYFINRK